ncbi:MAG: hypothetical protein NT069_27185 [Planctomycetota bacterium]|nr:hypothetical protein [Planctomycetota bacterium]
MKWDLAKERLKLWAWGVVPHFVLATVLSYLMTQFIPVNPYIVLIIWFQVFWAVFCYKNPYIDSGKIDQVQRERAQGKSQGKCNSQDGKGNDEE